MPELHTEGAGDGADLDNGAPAKPDKNIKSGVERGQDLYQQRHPQRTPRQ